MNVLEINAAFSYNYHEAFFWIKINEGVASVVDWQESMELFNDVVIENVLQMTGIENTPVEHTDVKQYHKVCITQQIQQVWDQYTVNTGK